MGPHAKRALYLIMFAAGITMLATSSLMFMLNKEPKFLVVVSIVGAGIFLTGAIAALMQGIHETEERIKRQTGYYKRNKRA